MDIKQTDLVLEIGSGNNPNSRADILCDRFVSTSHERAGEFAMVVDRPLVVADGIRLPFPDKTFDYVIASHVFEHMDDPLAFAKEIMRVGKSGFIEVPSAISERVFGWDFHHWSCALHDGVLTFTPKTEGERFNGFFHRLIAECLWFRRSFEAHEEVWYTRLYWQGKIPLRVDKKPMSTDELKELDERAWELLTNAKPEMVYDLLFEIRFFLRRVIRKLRKTVQSVLWWLRKLSGRREIIESLMKLCVCPACHGHLLEDGRKMRCEGCKTMYIVDGVIPILLSSSERKKGW